VVASVVAAVAVSEAVSEAVPDTVLAAAVVALAVVARRTVVVVSGAVEDTVLVVVVVVVVASAVEASRTVEVVDSMDRAEVQAGLAAMDKNPEALAAEVPAGSTEGVTVRVVSADREHSAPVTESQERHPVRTSSTASWECLPTRECTTTDKATRTLKG